MLTISFVLAWLVLALAVVCLLLICAVPPFWRHRRVLLDAVYALLGISLLFAVTAGFNFLLSNAGILYGFGFITSSFLAARLHIGRLPEQFLRRNTLFTALVLFVGHGLLLALLHAPPFDGLQTGIFIVALVVALGFSLQTIWALTHYIYDVKAIKPRAHTLPTVTLAIPARNETMSLTACLDAALQSDYPKLEIVVLDDCSHDNTSALIKSYAHMGVRFVHGEAPSSGWLGKTNAYAQLARDASGEIILFLGVDTLVEPVSISRLITYITAHRLDMVSVLPTARHPLFAATLLQDMRYVWQIVLPLTRRRVPVSSEAWAIRRSVLASLGGFAGVKHKIIPEGSFARRLMKAGRYHFAIANRVLPMSFCKSWYSQYTSAIRLLYPTFKRQPLRALAVVIGLLGVGVAPFVALMVMPMSTIWWLAFTTCALYVLLYGVILMRLQPRWWWLGMWLLPVVLLQHVIFILLSMARYEFSTVDWKGRNVCYPVLLHKRR